MHDDFYQMYLEELELIVPCTSEEEQELLEKLQYGNKAVKDRLIEGNLKRVLAYAKEYAEKGVLMEDLVQEANISLTLALESFSGGNFADYIEAEVRRGLELAVEDQNSEIQAEQEVLARVNVLKDVSQQMSEELGREATVEELADRMKMTTDEIKEIMKLTLDAMTLSVE